MALIAFGLNHTTAKLSLREQVAIVPQDLQQVLHTCSEQAQLQELVALSTCNRTEFYAVADDVAVAEAGLRAWCVAGESVSDDEIARSFYCMTDDDALKHMMRVGAGLDSMVLGEPQILGQMKTAFAEARSAGTVKQMLNRVFEQVLVTAKRVRSETAIGAHPVSVASAAVRLSKHIFADLSETTALLIGAGQTIALTARHLQRHNIKHIVIANRTLERAMTLAEDLSAEACLISDIPEQLKKADIVISSTASQLPILGKGMVEQALKARKHRPIFMVDIAVPRDVEEQVGELDDVYLYTVDDLKDIIDENMKEREQEARKSASIVEESLHAFNATQRALKAVDSVRAYREAASDVRERELEKAMMALNRGQAPEKVLQMLANGITNKLIHSPSIQMKKASEANDIAKLEWAHELLNIEPGTGPADEES
jgi:glutamyl-tRNA reductase